MVTCANLATLLSVFLIRWGGRSGSGIIFLLVGLAILAVLFHALTRPERNGSRRD
jgi:hypothetical protein